jgi:two-component system cell cycle sensor histidine kinase/response regulator CckA
MSAPETVHNGERSARTVLLVDDDDAVRHFLAACLARTGYTIVAARDGAEALDILTRTKPEIHLLVTDVDMPAMSGTELAVITTAALPQCEVLLVSGKPLPPEADGHGWDFLPKPFTPDVFIAAVEAMLHRPHGEARKDSGRAMGYTGARRAG